MIWCSPLILKTQKKRVDDLLRGTGFPAGSAKVCPQVPVTLSWVLSHDAAPATLCHPAIVTVLWALQATLSILPYCCLGQRTPWVPWLHEQTLGVKELGWSPCCLPFDHFLQYTPKESAQIIFNVGTKDVGPL